MKGYEVVIIWTTGEKEICTAEAIIDARIIEEGYKIAFGNQIQWTGIRERR